MTGKTLMSGMERFRCLKHVALLAAATAACGDAALAQSPDYMIQDCKLAAQQFYQEYSAGTDATYEGQRTDGTHAVNGNIYLKDRSTYFSCSYNAAGDKLVEFFADQKSWPSFVQGKGSPYVAGGGGSNSASTVNIGGVAVPKKALQSCVNDAASAMSVSAKKIKAVKAGQEGSDTYYIELAGPKKHFVCSVNSKGEIFDTRYGHL